MMTEKPNAVKTTFVYPHPPKEGSKYSYWDTVDVIEYDAYQVDWVEDGHRVWDCMVIKDKATAETLASKKPGGKVRTIRIQDDERHQHRKLREAKA